MRNTVGDILVLKKRVSQSKNVQYAPKAVFGRWRIWLGSCQKLFYTFDCRNSRFCLCIPSCVSLSSHSLPFRKSDLSPESHPLASGSFIVALVFEGAYLKSLAPCGHFDFLSTREKIEI